MDILYHMTLCPATEAQGKETKAGMLMVPVFSSQVTALHAEALLSSQCLSTWREEAVNNSLFTLLAHAAFVPPIKLLLSQLFLLLLPNSGEKRMKEWLSAYLAAGWSQPTKANAKGATI